MVSPGPAPLVNGIPAGVRQKTKYVGVFFRYGRNRFFNGKPDVCYDIIYRIGKTVVHEKIGWKSEGYTIQDAAEIRILRIRSSRHPELIAAPNETLPTITVGFMWKLYKKTPRGTTEHSIYEHHIAPLFEKREILSILPIEIEKFKASLSEKGLKNTTISRILTTFKAIVSYAFKNALLTGTNPFTLISFKNNGENWHRERFLSHREAEQILDGLNLYDCQLYCVVVIALYTGLRLSEVVNLRAEDINLEQGCIRIVNGKTGARDAFFPKFFEPTLKKILPSQKHEYLFTNGLGEKVLPPEISRKFAVFMKLTGFNDACTNSSQKIVFHTLRHTFCSWLAIAGVPLYTIAKLAGHKTITMTQRYAKLTPDNQRDALSHLQKP